MRLSRREVMLLCAATSVVPVARAPAQTITSSERVAVAGASVAYMAAAFVGAHLAIRDSLPEAPLGLRSHQSVRDEFFTGSGTALSPGLPMLAVQGIATTFLGIESHCPYSCGCARSGRCPLHRRPAL